MRRTGLVAAVVLLGIGAAGTAFAQQAAQPGQQQAPVIVVPPVE